MSIPQVVEGAIESKADLVAFLERGCKPRSEWRIGTEHEKFGFCLADHSPMPYDGPQGIAAFLKEFARRFGWEPAIEAGNIIGLRCPEATGAISLEPGGQLELSGAQLKTLHQTCQEVNTHLEEVRAVAADLGVGFLGLGFSPKWTLAETPHMPKGRYAVMVSHMPKVGGHGLDMMYRTCTVQVNLDFASENDMVKKLRVGLALQPIVTAIFSNSPFAEGRPNGYLSYRAEVWRDTDPQRTGLLPFAFEEGMGFERYVDYALDVPMYFVFRDGRYINVAGASFRDFLDGRLEALPGERPGMGDWADHLTTLFPETRVKNYIEMRGADGGPWRGLCALPALWAGLLYDSDVLEAAWDLAKGWSAEEREALRDSVPRLGLAARIGGRSVQDVAKDLVALAREGLTRRGNLNTTGDNETLYLDTVESIVWSGETAAERLLKRYHEVWKGDIDRLFEEEAY
ncbi:MAG: glutamate--cysteine ligase [Hyphomicrobiales bacterium]|nr:glutamate--cysteine ligase [Hyphomicrobiales bacterium]